MSSLIPYPNNELGPPIPPRSGGYATYSDYSISASYAETSSYTLGFILSASYAGFAATASYLLGSIANAVSASWAEMAGHALTAETASFALTSALAETASYLSGTASYALVASTASYVASVDTASYSFYAVQAGNAVTASYALVAQVAESATASYISGSSAVVNDLTLSNGGGEAYITSVITSSISTTTAVDFFPDTDGQSVKWLVSIYDGTSFKMSEIMAVWEPVSNILQFAEVTTNSIGPTPFPVSLSCNISGNNVRLIANPASGTWTIKAIRFVL